MGKLYEVYLIQKNYETETVRAESPEEAAAIAYKYSDHFYHDRDIQYYVEETEDADSDPEEDEDNGILTNVDGIQLPTPHEYLAVEQLVLIF